MIIHYKGKLITSKDREQNEYLEKYQSIETKCGYLFENNEANGGRVVSQRYLVTCKYCLNTN